MSERMAERHRELWQAELNGLLAGDERPMLWADFLEAYLSAKGVELAKASVRSARHILEDFAQVCRPRYLCDIDHPMADRYKVHRLAIRATDTVRKEIRTLQAAFSWALELGHVQTNPFKGIRFGRRHKKDIDAYTLEETGRLLAEAAKAPVWVQASILLSVRWGLRIDELASLERREIDFRERLVRVRSTDEWAPKSGRGRVVPLDEETAGLLQELSHREGPILWGPADQRFTSADGTKGYKRLVRQAVAEV
jgi:integrase